MGHANSIQGRQDVRQVNGTDASFNFEADANIVQSQNNVNGRPDVTSNVVVRQVALNNEISDAISTDDTIVPEICKLDECDSDFGMESDECDSDDMWTKTIPTVFRWEHDGKKVFLSGSFSDWNARIPMNSSNGEFETIIELPEGEHQFKYFVDGKWVHDPNLPTVNDTFGGRNNVLYIKKSDFEVMSALNSDDKQIDENLLSPTSSRGSYGQFIPSHHNPMVVNNRSIHSTIPPALPPQLLNVNLNKRVPNPNEPSLIPEPNHVSVNHMYALSIKDGVMVVSSCIRYRKKFITTLLYRPVTMPRG